MNRSSRRARLIPVSSPTTTFIAVYCGSSSGHFPEFSAAAHALGTALAAPDLGMVYGGGSVGLMGTVADACLDAGGRVHGVITQSLLDKEVGHLGLSNLDVVTTMHQRKARMEVLARGFVAMPGGFGTWEELCEVVTAAQLGHHTKPIVLLDVRHYWDPFMAFIDGAVDTGFIPESHRTLVRRSSNVDEVLELLRAPAPTLSPKWV